MKGIKFQSESERVAWFLERGILNKYCEQLKAINFFSAPAGMKHHGAYNGGLFDHSANVADVLETYTANLGLDWEREESPYIVGMLHDLCKVDQYEYDLETDSFKWSNDPVIKGHGIKSVVYIQNLGLKLTDEEQACIIYHMGAYTDKEEWKDYDNAIKKFPNVLYTHTADMHVSKVYGI